MDFENNQEDELQSFSKEIAFEDAMIEIHTRNALAGQGGTFLGHLRRHSNLGRAYGESMLPWQAIEHKSMSRRSGSRNGYRTTKLSSKQRKKTLMRNYNIQSLPRTTFDFKFSDPK